MSEVYKAKVDTRDEFLARIFDAAARIKKRQALSTTHDFGTWLANITEVDGGIVDHLLWIVTNVSFKHQIKIKIN